MDGRGSPVLFSPVLFFNHLIGIETEGLLDEEGRAGIISIVLRRGIGVGVKGSREEMQ